MHILHSHIKIVYHSFRDNDLMTYAAALAFHAMLALVPFLLFLFALVSFVDIGVVFDRLLYWSSTVLPPRGMQQIIRLVQRFQDREQAGLLSIGMVTTVWAASGGVRAAMTALSRAYNISERRSAKRRYLLSILFTIGVGILLIVGIGLMLIGPEVFGEIAGWFGVSEVFVVLWHWLRYPVAIALLTLGAALAYALLPCRSRFRLFTPGAILAVLLWIAVSLGLQLYLSVFGRYGAVYGSFGAVIVLMLFLWVSAFALLLGGTVNAVAEQRRIDTKDSAEVLPNP